MITTEQLNLCINYFLNIDYQIDIIRKYCIEKGKSEVDTEIFLQLLRNKALITGVNYITETAQYVIERKITENKIIKVLNSQGHIITLI